MGDRSILILGAGYTGKEMARRAVDDGRRVVGTTRSEETARFLTQLGASAVDWSIGDDPSLWVDELDASTAVVYSIPPVVDAPLDESGRLPAYVQHVGYAFDLCLSQDASRFVYLSSTSVYGDHGGEWIDETADCHPTSPSGKMRLEIERHLLDRAGRLPVSIGRLGGIYGPERTMVDYIASGRYRLVDGGKKPTNRIHVEDAARAILTIAERSTGDAEIFNLTDGHPQTVRDVVTFVCEKAEIEVPEEESLQEYADRVDNPNAVARWKNSYRVRSNRLRDELDFEFRYPDAFSGYRALLE